VNWWWHRERRDCDCQREYDEDCSAEQIALSIESVVINQEFHTMQVNLTWTTPALRADGTTPLALTEIQATNVRRNGTIIGTPTAVTGAMAFSDTSPLTGADVYTVETVTTDGFVSKLSNAVTITVAAANPAAAVTDLAGTLITP
jgi:hypothetical protein